MPSATDSGRKRRRHEELDFRRIDQRQPVRDGEQPVPRQERELQRPARFVALRENRGQVSDGNVFRNDRFGGGRERRCKDDPDRQQREPSGPPVQAIASFHDFSFLRIYSASTARSLTAKTDRDFAKLT